MYAPALLSIISQSKWRNDMLPSENVGKVYSKTVETLSKEKKHTHLKKCGNGRYYRQHKRNFGVMIFLENMGRAFSEYIRNFTCEIVIQ